MKVQQQQQEGHIVPQHSLTSSLLAHSPPHFGFPLSLDYVRQAQLKHPLSLD